MKISIQYKLLIIAVIVILKAGSAVAGVTVGSKAFTESYVLGEIAAQTLESVDPGQISRKLGMGSTGILFEALKSGAIDVYPDYTGTLAEAILKDPKLKSVEEIQKALAKMDLSISRPLGFNNTYALAVKEEFGEKNGLQSISDLVRLMALTRHPEIRAAFSYEFMDRQDGFRGMIERYHLQIPTSQVNRMEHSLAYQAIDDGSVELIEVYSTDAKIKKLRLRVLKDDLSYFPVYQAVWVARKAFVAEQPLLWKQLTDLESKIDENKMVDLNARADIDRESVQSIAVRFLGLKSRADDGTWQQISHRASEHLSLVGISLLFSLVVGIPLGIVAARFRLAGQTILVLSAVVQTLPSLALLCFLIPLFGVGTKPALVALCLYSLLPVVLNTFTGISSIDERHLENARAFGLNPRQILLRIVLPLASPTILAGVKTATILSIGTATLAALVGAGGFGVPIVSGLSLNDVPTILTGAIPAAVMALLAYGVFELLGRLVIPFGLRKKV